MSIFVSYSHSDKTSVEPIIELLELAFPDTKVFWDRELVGGDNTDDRLRKQVSWCQVFVFFASYNSMDEDSYCRHEVNWAKKLRKHIVPYCIFSEPEVVVGYLGGDNLFCIEAGEDLTECFAKLCGSIFRALGPHVEWHRKQMYMLYSILCKLDDHGFYQEAADVYERGYELEYNWTPSLDQSSMSEERCKEVLDILSMMERLQSDWKKLSDKDKAEIEKETHNLANYTISDVGFQLHEEAKEWGYLMFLRRHGRFAHLSLDGGDGRHTFLMLPTYRKMLEVFNDLREEQNGLSFFSRTLTPLEFIEIIGAKFPQLIESETQSLILDEDVTNQRGIYPYILTGEEKHSNIRAFTSGMMQRVYEKQANKCKNCEKSFDFSDMEADHVSPWSEGGKTVEDNCQMLCRKCNLEKSSK